MKLYLVGGRAVDSLAVEAHGHLLRALVLVDLLDDDSLAWLWSHILNNIIAEKDEKVRVVLEAYAKLTDGSKGID